MTEAWEEANGTKLDMGCLLVNREWAEANPTVIKVFMQSYKDSVNLVNSDPAKGADYIVKAGIMQMQLWRKPPFPIVISCFSHPTIPEKIWRHITMY